MTPGNKVRSSEQLHSSPIPRIWEKRSKPPAQDGAAELGRSVLGKAGRKEGKAWDVADPKGKFPEQTLEGFPRITGKVGKLLLELLELSPDPKELPAGIPVSQSRGMGASSLSLADSRGWEWRGFLWSTEDSPGAAPPLPGTSGTANPGKVVALSWFLGTNSPPRPFGSRSAAPSPEREFRGGASSWEFRRSLFPAVFQGAASQCSESKELLHPAGSGDPLGAARTLGDDPSPGIPMDFNGKTPLAELLFHERCYKSRPPCRLQLGFGGKNPQSLKKFQASG